ncbi:MAG: hypothetical protein WC869_01300 [Phycisphaerae bacterium]|jgi:hypothetical protein
MQTDPVKGQTACNRTACQRVFGDRDRFWNTSTRAWYCQGCAAKINRSCVDYGDPIICFRESEVKNLPADKQP